MARRIIRQVKLKEVVFNEKVYPRANVNWQTSFDYANSLKVGAKFPPITLALFKRKLILVDGKHRLDAFKQCKKKTIFAEIFSGWDLKRIFVESIKRNISHGRMLSPFEKRKCIMRLREMKVSNSNISLLIQIPQEKIENFVGQRLISSTTGEDISLEIVKSGIKHIAGKTYDTIETQSIVGVQKEMYIKDQIYLFDQLIGLFEKGLVDLGNNKINEKILKLSKLMNLVMQRVG